MKMESNLLLKNVLISDPGHPDATLSKDIRIRSGIITEIEQYLSPEPDEYCITAEDGEQLNASSGWMDLFSIITDPGYEDKESFSQWSAAAVSGGFTECLAFPETHPYADTGEAVLALLNRNTPHAPTLHILGALTQKLEGRQIAEFRDMMRAGTGLFSQGLRPSVSGGCMRIALEYLKGSRSQIVVFPFEESLSKQGQVHEGKSAIFTGLKGIPTLTESLIVYRDCALSELCNVPVHFTGISTQKSLKIIEDAKQRGIQVTASVFSTHLKYTEDVYESFDAQYKIMPPFRSHEDREALRNAVCSGVLDGIASGHVPTRPEEKNVEFTHAEFGMRNLSQSFRYAWESLVSTQLMRPADLIHTFVKFPRTLCGLPEPELKTGVKANLTLWKTFKSKDSLPEISGIIKDSWLSAH